MKGVEKVICRQTGLFLRYVLVFVAWLDVSGAPAQSQFALQSAVGSLSLVVDGSRRIRTANSFRPFIKGHQQRSRRKQHLKHSCLVLGICMHAFLYKK